MHDIRPERVIALERENTELRECIDKLFQQITELSAKYEAPSDAIATQQRALYDVPSHGMTNEMYLKSLATKQLAKLYAQNFFCQHYMKTTSGGIQIVTNCPLKDICEEYNNDCSLTCEEVVERWLKTQQFKTIKQFLTVLNLNN